MNRMILLLITLTTHINVSYASFPIQSSFVTYKDTLQTDKIKEYHSRLIRMGIDLNSCKCESCRDGNAVSWYETQNPLTVNSRSSSSLYKTAAILFTLALIVFVVWMLDGVACINDVSTCSSNNIPLISYISLLMLFGYSSIFYFIKGLLAQKKNK